MSTTRQHHEIPTQRTPQRDVPTLAAPAPTPTALRRTHRPTTRLTTRRRVVVLAVTTAVAALATALAWWATAGSLAEPAVPASPASDQWQPGGRPHEEKVPRGFGPAEPAADPGERPSLPRLTVY